MISLEELKIFVTAAEEGNFSRAARKLHLSQSAVSQNIQSIERAYGVELFTRRGRSVRLGEVGEAMLPLAREVLNSARALEDSLRNSTGRVSGEIAIGCSTTAGKYLLPNLSAAFRRSYPEVRVRVNVMTRMEVVNRLLAETICLGVVSKRIDHRDLIYQPFFEDRVILIVPADHPWTKVGRAIPSDLLDQPIILREETSGTREVLLDGLKEHQITLDMLDIAMEVGNAEACEMAVEEKIGISFVSEMVAARALAMGRVRQIEVEGLDLRRTIYAARRIACPLTHAQSYFWDFVQAQRERLATDLLASLRASVPPAVSGLPSCLDI